MDGLSSLVLASGLRDVRSCWGRILVLFRGGRHGLVGEMVEDGNDVMTDESDGMKGDLSSRVHIPAH